MGYSDCLRIKMDKGNWHQKSNSDWTRVVEGKRENMTDTEYQEFNKPKPKPIKKIREFVQSQKKGK